MNHDPDNRLAGNALDLNINGETVAYADESIYEHAASVGPKPQTFKLTGSLIEGEYLEISVVEYDFEDEEEETFSGVFKQAVTNGKAVFEYTTKAVGLPSKKRN